MCGDFWGPGIWGMIPWGQNSEAIKFWERRQGAGHWEGRQGIPPCPQEKAVLPTQGSHCSLSLSRTFQRLRRRAKS